MVFILSRLQCVNVQMSGSIVIWFEHYHHWSELLLLPWMPRTVLSPIDWNRCCCYFAKSTLLVLLLFFPSNPKIRTRCRLMTSSNGNIFRVTGPLWGEFTGPGEFPTQRPVTRSFDVFFDLRLNKRLSKQPWGWWFEMPSWSLWRQCNGFPWMPNNTDQWRKANSHRSNRTLTCRYTWMYK